MARLGCKARNGTKRWLPARAVVEWLNALHAGLDDLLHRHSPPAAEAAAAGFRLQKLKVRKTPCRP